VITFTRAACRPKSSTIWRRISVNSSFGLSAIAAERQRYMTDTYRGRRAVILASVRFPRSRCRCRCSYVVFIACACAVQQLCRPRKNDEGPTGRRMRKLGRSVSRSLNFFLLFPFRTSSLFT